MSVAARAEEEEAALPFGRPFGGIGWGSAWVICVVLMMLGGPLDFEVKVASRNVGLSEAL